MLVPPPGPLALKTSEASFRATLYCIGDALIATDDGGLITVMNPVAEKLTGWPQVEALGKPLLDVFHIINEDTRRLAVNPVERVLREGIVVGLANHTALIARDGTERPIEDSGAPVYSDDGGIQGAVLVFRDVTQERQREDALRQSEERFRLLVDNVQDYAIYMLDPSGKVASWNAGAQRIKGYLASEIVGQEYSVFFTPEDVALGRPAQYLAEALRDGQHEEEGWRVRKDGTRFWASVVLTPVHDEKGVLRGFAKVTRDVTERRAVAEIASQLAAERAVSDERRRVADTASFLSNASAILASSLDYSVTLQRVADLATPTMADWCSVDVFEEGTWQHVAVAHVDPAKLQLAHDLRERYPPDPETSGATRVFRTGASELYSEIPDEMLVQGTVDAEHLRLARELGLKSAMVVPLVARGAIVGVLTLVAAESNRRYTKDDLVFAEELGRRAGIAVDNARLFREAKNAVKVRDEFLSIAGHELQTPLAALALQVVGIERMFKKDPGAVESILERLGKMGRHCKRIERLINQLLDVSRMTSGRFTLEHEEVDLVGLVEEVVERLGEQRASAGCVITTEGPPTLLGMWDRLRLDQALTNLLTNALKYGERKPIVLRLHRDGDNAFVSVRDHGIGIASEHQKRIFGRFERAGATRHFGGLGLGLWITHKIAEAHGGTIRVESALGEGATFTLEVPCRPT